MLDYSTKMATTGNLVVSTGILFIVLMVSSSFVDTLRTNHLQDGLSMQFEMRQEFSNVQRFTRSKRSLARRVRRDTGDTHCHEQENAFLTKLQADKNKDFLHVYEFQNETKFSLALAWAGENVGKILIATTEEFLIFAQKSDLYQSVDDGKTWQQINSRINGAQIHKTNGVQKHPFMSERVFIVAYSSDNGGNSQLYITTNGGDTFEHVLLPFVFEEAFVFHPSPSKTDYMLARAHEQGKLYLSEDGGHNWREISQHVSNFKWSTGSSLADAKTIYVTKAESYDPSDFFAQFNPTQIFDLYKTADLGTSWSCIHKDVYTFGIQGDFLYTSVQKGTNGERIMEVSKTGGHLWNEVQLPSITPDRFYSILDMSEGLVFMHVDNPGDTGHGVLYTSDVTGIIFAESLANHLYPNYQDLTDFYKVKSMRGVYISSQMADDQSIHTMISYDRGGEWKPIERPAGVPCKDESKPCYLQIHNMYSIARQIMAQPPLSIENAVGLIMVHGHIADSLQTTHPDVFVSSDGGYSWYKALDGPHHYQIADHGGLLVAVPADSPTVDTVKFSTDEGRCWHSYKFTNKSILFTGLLTEPGNRAMSVGIWGFGQDDHMWRVHVINFTKVIDRQCSRDSDYEPFVAHSDNSNDGCLLGVKETFERLRKDSWCYNGYSYQQKSNNATCACTKADYECDYGYYRETGQEVCKEDPRAVGNELDICYRGHEEEIVTKGYRKIPGDQCKGGFQPAGEKITDLHKRCKEGDKSLQAEFTAGLNQWSDRMPRMSKSGMILMSVVLLILLLTLIMLVYFVRKCQHLRTLSPSYRYQILKQGDQDDKEIEEALGASTSLYEDTSDEEMPLAHSGLPNGSAARSNGALSVMADMPVLPAFSPKRTPPKPDPQRKPEVKSYHDDSDVDMLE